ncbi:hypothetical protein CRUP_024777, partial [Coryphaenoides rupestris]
RIRAEHPPSEKKTVIRQDRLLGLLMPFRAFGDVKFKWSIELQKRVLESGPDQLHENEHTKFIPPNYHTPPYLTAEPEITHHRLRPQDRFLCSLLSVEVELRGVVELLSSRALVWLRVPLKTHLRHCRRLLEVRSRRVFRLLRRPEACLVHLDLMLAPRKPPRAPQHRVWPDVVTRALSKFAFRATTGRFYLRH